MGWISFEAFPNQRHGQGQIAGEHNRHWLAKSASGVASPWPCEESVRMSMSWFWSLMGSFQTIAICSKDARACKDEDQAQTNMEADEKGTAD